MTVRKCSIVSTGRYTVQYVAIVKSYTPQSADLMWLTIELETLDISGMVYGKIAERVAQRTELRQGGYLL